MEKTQEKSKTISQFVAELEDYKKEYGDIEVFIANTDDEFFDGVGRLFVIINASKNEKCLGIIRSNVVLKL